MPITLNGATGITAPAYNFSDINAGSVANTAGSQTISNKFFSGSVLSGNIKEKITVSSAAATGTVALDVITQQVLFYTSNATGNFSVNIRGNSSTTLNSIMNTGEAVTITFLVTNGGTAYYNTTVLVDNTTVTARWQGGRTPDKGNANSVDSYTYTVIKTGNAAFTVFGAQVQFATT